MLYSQQTPGRTKPAKSNCQESAEREACLVSEVGQGLDHLSEHQQRGCQSEEKSVKLISHPLHLKMKTALVL